MIFFGGRAATIKSRANCTWRSGRRACRWDRLSTAFRFQRTRRVLRRSPLRRRTFPGLDERASENFARRLDRSREKKEPATVIALPAGRWLVDDQIFVTAQGWAGDPSSESEFVFQDRLTDAWAAELMQTQN
jgi:hypothetical protein